jgi:hypothetical protein
MEQNMNVEPVAFRKPSSPFKVFWFIHFGVLFFSMLLNIPTILFFVVMFVLAVLHVSLWSSWKGRQPYFIQPRDAMMDKIRNGFT